LQVLDGVHGVSLTRVRDGPIVASKVSIAQLLLAVRLGWSLPFLDHDDNSMHSVVLTSLTKPGVGGLNGPATVRQSTTTLFHD